MPKRLTRFIQAVGVAIFASLPLTAPFVAGTFQENRKLDAFVSRPGRVAVTRGAVVRSIRLDAVVVPRRSASIRAADSGRVASVLARPGDLTDSGRPLVRLTAGRTITAPLTGRIASLSVVSGELVQPGQVIGVVDSEDLLALAPVDPATAAFIPRKPQKVTVDIVEGAAGVTCEFLGVFRQTSGAEENSFPSGDREFVYQAVCRLSAVLSVLPGNTARIRIEIASAPNVLIVPRTAIEGGSGGAFATRVVGNHSERVRVEVGLMGEFVAEIRSGLREGDIVLDGATARGA